MTYDKGDKYSILKYAQQLEGLTIREQMKSSQFELDSTTNKGGFGNILERIFFEIPNNSESRPDFEEAGLELKASPLKLISSGKLKAKERIVLGIINYHKIVDENFITSHLIYKNKELLLVFYLHESDKSVIDLKIKLVDLWNILSEDKEMIKQDWEFIVNKVRKGEAHLISEGDTFYLGACTKGSTAKESYVTQPNSTEFAKRRAFAFKQRYVNVIIEEFLERKKIRRDQKRKRIIEEKPAGMSFEDYIKSRFIPFIGKTEQELRNLFHLNYTSGNKSKYALISKAILGAKENEELDEFIKAGIKIRTIRIEANDKMKESLSFRQIRYTEIIEEEWENSSFYDEITRKFFFIIFRRNTCNTDFTLFDVRFWNMPEQDLEVVHQVWEDTKQKIKNGSYLDFTKISDNFVAHVRPKGMNNLDVMETPQGTLEKKKCFWLNQKYIENQIFNSTNSDGSISD
jgi:DNA mismatch repair protein MutH